MLKMLFMGKNHKAGLRRFKGWAVILLVIFNASFFTSICWAKSITQSSVHISSSRIPQGGISVITIQTVQREHPIVSWLTKQVYLVPDSSETRWQGFLAVDLKERPGRYEATVSINPSLPEMKVEVEILTQDYGIGRLTLPKHMVELDDETLQRVSKEQKNMNGLWEKPHPTPLWNGRFLRPVPGEIISPFGTGRIINGQPRSPHSGVDLRGQTGTPIKVINHGKVVLTDDYFFSGKSVVVDHGGEILSMYFHLEKILVHNGEIVEKGQVIGLVGSTGRASGPHLHWGIRLNGARIDPVKFIELSQQLEE